MIANRISLVASTFLAISLSCSGCKDITEHSPNELQELRNELKELRNEIDTLKAAKPSDASGDIQELRASILETKQAMNDLLAGRTELTSTHFFLVDSSGKRIGLWGKVDGTATLALLDNSGNPGVVLSASDDGPVVSLMDRNGNTTLSLASAQDGPALLLFNKFGINRIGLGIDGEKAMLRFLDTSGQPNAGILSTSDGGTFGTYDKNGNPSWVSP